MKIRVGITATDSKLSVVCQEVMQEQESRFQIFRRKKKAQQQAANNDLRTENMELQTEVMKLRLENAALASTVQTLREVMSIPAVTTFSHVMTIPGVVSHECNSNFDKQPEMAKSIDSMVGFEDDNENLTEFDEVEFPM